MKKWWASYRVSLVGPYDSRDEAAKALFDACPRVKVATTGYGEFGPYFDIQWVKRLGTGGLRLAFSP